MGHLGRVARIILAPVQNDAHLGVTGERLHEVAIEIGLAARDDDDPALGGLAVQVVLWFGVWHCGILAAVTKQSEGHFD